MTQKLGVLRVLAGTTYYNIVRAIVESTRGKHILHYNVRAIQKHRM